MIRSKASHDIQLLYKVNNNIKKRNLLKPSERILVAVSGGQDSICIIKIMMKLQQKWQWKVGMVHCDHRWHITSESQAKHVARLASNMEIDYYQPVCLQYKKQENYARNWRYQMIQKIALQYNYTSIITAHNASDRIETIIYNIIRGTGGQGLQSLNWKRYLNNWVYIPAKMRPGIYPIFWKKVHSYKIDRSILYHRRSTYLKIARPLLDITRTDLSLFFFYWHIPAWPDVSNDNISIRRNRVRHRLLPYLRFFFNPCVDGALGRFSEIIFYENMYFNRITDILLDKIMIYINTDTSGIYAYAINIELLRCLPIAYQRRVLKRFIYRETKITLSFIYLEHVRLYALFAQNYPRNRTFLYLPRNRKLLIIKKILLYLY